MFMWSDNIVSSNYGNGYLHFYNCNCGGLLIKLQCTVWASRHHSVVVVVVVVLSCFNIIYNYILYILLYVWFPAALPCSHDVPLRFAQLMCVYSHTISYAVRCISHDALQFPLLSDPANRNGRPLQLLKKITSLHSVLCSVPPSGVRG